SLISEEVVEEGPEVVFTEAVGPDGKPVLIEGKPRVVKKIKTPQVSEVIPESKVKKIRKKKPEVIFSELTGPDGSPFLVPVEETLVIEQSGPDGSQVLVEIQKTEDELTEEEKRKVKKVKKLRKKPEDLPKVQEADLVSLPSEQIVEEAPEVIYTQAIDKTGQPILVEVQVTPEDAGVTKKQKRRIIKKVPRSKTDEDIKGSEEETPKTNYITAIGPDGAPLIVEVKESDLTVEEKEKIKLTKKIKKKKLSKISDLPSDESAEDIPEVQFIEIPGPDGAPVTVQIFDVKDDITEEEKVMTKVVKKIKKKKPKDDTEGSLERPEDQTVEETEEVKPLDIKKKQKRRPKIIPADVLTEVTEVIGPDGTTDTVEVEEIMAVEAVGPDGRTILVEVKETDEDLTEEERKKIKKIKKLRKKPRVVSEKELESDEVIEEVPEVVYTEEVSPQGKPILVEGKPRMVKKIKRKPKDVSDVPTEEETPVYLDVTGLDGAPVTLKVVDVKPELSPEDLERPRLSKKKVKKTRAGPKESPTTHFVEALGPDGSTVIVEVNENDLKEEEKVVLTIKKKIKKPIPEATELSEDEDEVTIIEQKPVQPKRKKAPKETQVTEIVGPDGTPQIVEVEDTLVKEVKGPDGTVTLVEVQEEDLTEEEKRKVKRIKKIRKKPHEIAEAELPSISPDEVFEEVPEVVFTEEVGPDGTPVLVEGQSRVVKKIKRKPHRASEVPSEEEEGPVFLEVPGPDGSPIKVEVLEVKPELSVEDFSKPMLSNKKVKRTITGRKESITTHFVDALGPDGTPFIVEVNESDLKEEEKRILTIKKKVRRPKVPVEQEADEKRVRRPKEVPIEFTEVTGPDGQPTIVEVQETLVIEEMGPEGIPVLVEITELEEERLPEDKRRRVKKVRKITRKPSVSEEILKSLPADLIVEEIPEVVYSEAIGPDGKPVLVQGPRRLVKKTKPISVSVPEDLPDEEEAPVFLEVTGPDGTPVTVQVLSAKPELTEEDLDKPRLSKKKVKKTRAGPKESPTTHFIEALGPDGSPVIVEVNESELKEEEKRILSVKSKAKKPKAPSHVTTDVEKKSKRREKPAPKVEFTEIVGPDGKPTVVVVEETLAIEDVSPDGKLVLVELSDQQEEDLTQEEKLKVRKVKKIPRKPSVSEGALN
ncbi:unnamed protein product, partial [Allacma fusca]